MDKDSLKLINRFLKEMGICKMYYTEKKMNSNPHKLEELGINVQLSHYFNVTLYWNETQYPLFWAALCDSLVNYSLRDLAYDMEGVVRKIKLNKELCQYKFW